MRPVNLIPPEERRGERAPLRTGPVAYGLVGLLALVLLAVTALVMTNNSISERESELAALEAREAETQARAQALAPYAEFAALSQARDATVASLANSRFDWERVLRELSLVITDDVWLTGITGTASPEVAVEGATSISLRPGVPGPALELVGCGKDQDAIAEFVAALNDIDGVTRVGLQSTERDPDVEVEAAGDTEGSESDDDCRTRPTIPLFEIVVAFDAAPASAPSADGAAPAAPVAPAPAGADAAAEQTGEAQSAAAPLTGGAQ